MLEFKGIIRRTGMSVLLSAIIGCGASSPEVREIENISVQELKEKVNSNSKNIESFRGEGSISFESPRESNSGSIEIRLKKPDSLYIKIGGPFGISIAAALITRSEFLYYNVQENKAISGPTTELNIGAILKIKMGFDELMDCITASFSFAKSDFDTSEADIRENYYHLAVRETEFHIEPSMHVIRRYARNDFVVKYSKFRRVSSAAADGREAWIPGEITIEMPTDKQTVQLSYDSIEINRKDMSFRLKVPKSAKMINWE